MGNLKTFLTGLALLLIISLLSCCGAGQNKENKSTKNEQTDDFSVKDMDDKSELEDDGDFVVSHYDNGLAGDYHLSTLKQLSEAGIFVHFHKKALKQLIEKHKNYFKSKPDFELLYSTKGDLFHNGKDDYAFIVYDKKNVRTSILLYDESENKYYELYRDMMVVGELEKFPYSHYGTLDFIIGSNIVSRDLFFMPVENFLNDFKPCMITDILTNKIFDFEIGSFAKNISKEPPLNSLCIETKYHSNNWQCLSYDKSKNRFKMVYGQAEEIPESEPIDDDDYIVSGYEDGYYQDGLRDIGDEGILTRFHNRAFPQLIEKHKNYFKSKPDFELLYSTKGDLFHNGKDDYAFIVYDKQKYIIIILLYDEFEKKYAELYRDIKVEGNLADCKYYGGMGALDGAIGGALGSYGLRLEYVENFINDFQPCMIADILMDDTFRIDEGCFADDVSRKPPLQCLCIATCFVYNNWGCLYYDRHKKRFKVVFKQEFVD